MKFLKPEAENILKRIRLLVLDVDGVLTDGYIIYHDDGRETKTFDVKDGFGLRLMKIAGIEICITTGRMSGALQHRCKNLGIELIFDGLRHKAASVDELIERRGIPSD